jgi:hypothetical protein
LIVLTVHITCGEGTNALAKTASAALGHCSGQQADAGQEVLFIGMVNHFFKRKPAAMAAG